MKLCDINLERISTSGVCLAVFNGNAFIAIMLLASNVVYALCEYWTDATTFDTSLSAENWIQLDDTGNCVNLSMPLYFFIESDGTNLFFYLNNSGNTHTKFLVANEAIATNLGGITHLGIMTACNSGHNSSVTIDHFRRVA